MPLTSAEARTISAQAREHADKIAAQITVAIVDEGGTLQILDRMDGAPPLSARIAPAKAASAALFHRDGAALRQLQASWPEFFVQVDRIAGTPIIAGAGSQLIRRADRILGAVAVSGGRPEQDDECAQVAVAGVAALTDQQTAGYGRDATIR